MSSNLNMANHRVLLGGVVLATLLVVMALLTVSNLSLRDQTEQLQAALNASNTEARQLLAHNQQLQEKLTAQSDSLALLAEQQRTVREQTRSLVVSLQQSVESLKQEVQASKQALEKYQSN